MRTSTTSILIPLTTLVSLLHSVSATYFTSPQTSTVWDTAPGQTITWHFQAGGAASGDIVLQAVGLSGSGSTVTIASNVDLTTESLTFPQGVALRSNTRQYELMIVNSQDPSFAYTTVGPFEIDSFQGSAAPASSSSSSSSAASSSSSSNDSRPSEGAPHTATNPPVSTTTSSSPPLSTVTRDVTTAQTTTTTPAASSTSKTSSKASSTAEETEESSSSSEEASPTTSAAAQVTTTYLSTASPVLITSTLSQNTSSTVRTASVISASRPTAESSNNTSGAALRGKVSWWGSIVTGGIVVGFSSLWF